MQGSPIKLHFIQGFHHQFPRLTMGILNIQELKNLIKGHHFLPS